MCVWTTVCVLFRHKEAIKKWDEAIQLTPDNPDLYEMKSQVIFRTKDPFFGLMWLQNCFKPHVRFYRMFPVTVA